MGAKDGDNVRVHYRGTLDSGEEFDSSEGREPLAFALGGGQVIPGFEDAVRGLEPGETRRVRIEPEDAYGDHFPEAVQQVPRDMFTDDPYVDAVVQFVSPEDPDEVFAARIVRVEDEYVTVDFNHALAGEALTFDVELVEILDGEKTE